METTYYSGIPVSHNYLDQKDYWDISMEIYQSPVLNQFHFLPQKQLLYHLSVHLLIQVPLPLMNGVFETNLQEVISCSTALTLRAWVWLWLGQPKMLGAQSKLSKGKVLICDGCMPRKLLIKQFTLREQRSRSILSYFKLRELQLITWVHPWWMMRPRVRSKFGWYPLHQNGFQ